MSLKKSNWRRRVTPSDGATPGYVAWLTRFGIITVACLMCSCGGGLSVLMSGGKSSGTNTAPFRPGEKLTYRMIWNYIPVGDFTVQVEEPKEIGGELAWHFKMRVKTNSFADTFYKVRNSVDGYAHPSLTHSLKYDFDQEQGNKTEVKTITYQSTPPKVRLIKDGVDKGWVSLPKPCVDPLSLFYVVRTRDIKKVGDKIPIWVSDGQKHIECNVNVLKKETITVNDEERSAYLLEPDLKELHSVFQRSKGARIKVWVSDDQYKIPLKVASKVIVGSFEAKLTGFETGHSSSKIELKDK